MTDPGDGAAADVQPTGRPNARMRQTIGDMIRSMAVVLGVVLVIVLLAWRPSPDAVKVVETTPTVLFAAAQSEVPLQQPTGLSPEWRATSVRWAPTEKSGSEPVLHIGYVTPTDAYAQVAQSAASSDAYLDEQTDGGTPVGDQDVAGRAWQRWESTDRRSLVQVDGPVVVVVSGTADWAELTDLAASLTPVATAG